MLTLILEKAIEVAGSDFVAVAKEIEVLKMSGPDTVSFLQGQLSQNVETQAVGETRWTLLLQPQGKVCVLGRIYRHVEDEFWLLTDDGYAAPALERLERFKLNVKVDLEVSAKQVLTIRGPNSHAAAQHLGEIIPNSLAVIGFEWRGAVGVDLVLSEVLIGAELESLEIENMVDGNVADELLEILRIDGGLPAMGSELSEATIPAAAGIVDQSVDFEKGCYTGQELVARIDSRGNNTPTFLAKLVVGTQQDSSAQWPTSEDLKSGPVSLSHNGAEVGQLTSAAIYPSGRLIGLGYFKRTFELPFEGTLEATGFGPANVIVAKTI